MADLEKKITKIIAKLDAAREALADLTDIMGDKERMAGIDSRVRLQTDLREFTDYLEAATWWRNGGKSSAKRSPK